MKYITIEGRIEEAQIQFKIPVVGKETLQRLLSSTRWPALLTFEGWAPPMPSVALFDVARMVAEDSHPGDDVLGPQHMLNVARELVSLHRLARQIPKGGILEVTGEIARACCDGYDDDLHVWAGHAFSDLGINIPGSGRCGPERAALVLACGVLLFEAKRLERSLLFAGAAA